MYVAKASAECLSRSVSGSRCLCLCHSHNLVSIIGPVLVFLFLRKQMCVRSFEPRPLNYAALRKHCENPIFALPKSTSAADPFGLQLTSVVCLVLLSVGCFKCHRLRFLFIQITRVFFSPVLLLSIPPCLLQLFVRSKTPNSNNSIRQAWPR